MDSARGARSHASRSTSVQNGSRMNWWPIAVRAAVFLILVLPNDVYSRRNHRAQSFKISPKPCRVDGESGTCMFVWECVRGGGRHLGMCVDDFMFGTCCTNASAPSSSSNAFVSSASTSSSGSIVFPGGDTASVVSGIVQATHHQYHRPAHPPHRPTAAPHHLVTSAVRPPSPPFAHFVTSASFSTPFYHSPASQQHHTTWSLNRPTTPSPVRTTPRPSTTRRPPVNRRPASTTTTTTTTSRPTTTTAMTTTKPTSTTRSPPSTTKRPQTTTTKRPSAKPTTRRPPSTTTRRSSTTTTRTTPRPSVRPTTRPMAQATPSSSSSPPPHFITRPGPPSPPHWANRPRPPHVPSTTRKPPLVHKRPPPPPSTTKRPTTTTTVATTTTTTTTRKPTTEGPTTTPKSTAAPVTLSLVGGASTWKECGIIPFHPRPETRIVGGKNAAFGGWPWQVSVRRTSFFGFSSTHRCGGAVLNENWIATAGHCVDDLLTSQIRIRVGEHDFSTVGSDSGDALQQLQNGADVLEPLSHVERGVARKVVHPRYNFFTYEYDLALVRLSEPLPPPSAAPHVAPICLPGSDDLLVGENATVTGWGRLSEGGTLPSILQQVTVPIVSNEKCKSMFLRAGRHEFIPDIFLCAGYEEGGRDSCQGDSGGPLQVRGKDGRYFLAGIISWGIGCAEANLPGVCTRISKFVDWILENVT